MTAAFAVFVAGLVLAAAVLFTGGGILRGLADRHRAEVERDARWDADHGTAP